MWWNLSVMQNQHIWMPIMQRRILPIHSTIATHRNEFTSQCSCLCAVSRNIKHQQYIDQMFRMSGWLNELVFINLKLGNMIGNAIQTIQTHHKQELEQWLRRDCSLPYTMLLHQMELKQVRNFINHNYVRDVPNFVRKQVRYVSQWLMPLQLTNPTHTSVVLRDITTMRAQGDVNHAHSTV